MILTLNNFSNLEQLENKQNEEEKKAYQKCENENQLDTDECVYWSSWSAWPGCSTSCGSSYQVSRSRSCKQQKGEKIKKIISLKIFHEDDLDSGDSMNEKCGSKQTNFEHTLICDEKFKILN